MKAKIAGILLGLLILNSLPIQAGPPVQRDDSGAYAYFNSLLLDFGEVLDLISEGSNESVKRATQFYEVTGTAYEEVLTYSNKGVGENVLKLSRLFRDLGENSLRLATSVERLRMSMTTKDYSTARQAHFTAEASLEECSRLLEQIKGVSLLGANGENLTLDVENVTDSTSKLRSILSTYGDMLSRTVTPSDFEIIAASPEMIAGENITFKIFVNTSAYPFLSQNTFEFSARFNKPGEYVLYGITANGSRLTFSKPVVVKINKIPTRIVTSEYPNGVLRLEGHLIDYSGNPLLNKTVYLIIDGYAFPTITEENGLFYFNISGLTEPINATLIFKGDELYEGTETNVTLVPPKPRPVIRLFPPEGSLLAGKTFEINGLINGTDEEIPLEVVVDGKVKKVERFSGEFSLLLSLGSGNHTVQVVFPGNDRYERSESNIVELDVKPYSLVRRLIIAALVLIIGALLYRLAGRRRKPHVAEVEEPPSQMETGVIEGSSPTFIEAYRLLYTLLLRLYRLPRSLTPRELLKTLRGEPFFRELGELTYIHEAMAYGKKVLGERALARGLRKVSNVIATVIVRDEL